VRGETIGRQAYLPSANISLWKFSSLGSLSLCRPRYRIYRSLRRFIPLDCQLTSMTYILRGKLTRKG